MNPFRKNDYSVLAERTLEMLRKVGSPDLVEVTARYLKKCDPRDVIDYLLAEIRQKDGQSVEAVLEKLGDAPYAEVLPDVRASLTEAKRLNAIMSLRSTTKDKGQRYFLGILLNAPNRDVLYALLADAFAGQDPSAVFLEGLKTLAAAGVGFPEDDSSIDLVGPLMDGASNEQVILEMQKRYGDEVLEMKNAIVESCGVLRRHPLLTPFLPAVRSP